MVKKTLLTLSSLSVLTLTGCHGLGLGGAYTPQIENAKYWQRNTASSALYLQGPKAQQMLHQNIATCVNEIKELQRLGEIRRSIPANYNSGNEIEARTAPQQELDVWDTPERDGYLYGEHLDYHDFETCMGAKGWERIEHLPYDEADVARKAYLERYQTKKKMKKLGERENVTTLHKTYTSLPSQIGVNE
jgi:hypothetical protein